MAEYGRKWAFAIGPHRCKHTLSHTRSTLEHDRLRRRCGDCHVHKKYEQSKMKEWNEQRDAETWKNRNDSPRGQGSRPLRSTTTTDIVWMINVNNKSEGYWTHDQLHQHIHTTGEFWVCIRDRLPSWQVAKQPHAPFFATYSPILLCSPQRERDEKGVFPAFSLVPPLSHLLVWLLGRAQLIWHSANTRHDPKKSAKRMCDHHQRASLSKDRALLCF